MLKFRTKLLLFVTGIFGVGIGVLSGLSDGAYSAVCLFMLPLLVALGGVSILVDFSRPTAQLQGTKEAVTTKASEPASTFAWSRPVVRDVSRQWSN